MSKEMKSRYCKDIKNIENYEKAKADSFIGWVIHHRLETHNSDGERRLVDIKMDELVALGMYWHRPANELIFMRSSEHKKLHNENIDSPMLGKHHSTAAKKRISEGHKGQHWRLTEETKRRMSKASKGKHWYNNGKENKFCYECPEGFVPGMLERK